MGSVVHVEVSTLLEILASFVIAANPLPCISPFQPFLRFWRICCIDVGWQTNTSWFQPFLRFWFACNEFGPYLERLLYVSTLLEILV